MPNGTTAPFLFPSFDRRKIEASFDGGNVSSDGGLMLLRQVEERLGLIKDFSQVLPDDRHPSLISHSQEELLAQRIFGLAQGYEDLNDHDTLRHDLLWQTAVHRKAALASSPTLPPRKKGRPSKCGGHASNPCGELIAALCKAPKRLTLVLTSPTTGCKAIRRAVFSMGINQPLRVSYLRPSNIDSSRHA